MSDAISKTYYYDYLRGPAGQNGQNGLSAFDLWVQMVECGIFIYPYDCELTYIDMFKFLKGKDGKDGKDGKSDLTSAEVFGDLAELYAEFLTTVKNPNSDAADLGGFIDWLNQQ